MNLPDADATRLAQEAAARLKRSALIAKEAGRFADMAKKVGSKTRPALRLLAESERLQGEADVLKAEAAQLLAQSHELLPAAEIIATPMPPVKISPVDSTVVDVEPVAILPKPMAARIVVPVPKPPVATEKWGAGITPPTESFTPSPAVPKPVFESAKPIQPVQPIQEISRPVVAAAKPAPPKTETPSPVLREVNRLNERPPEKPKPFAPAPKSAPEKVGFFKRLFKIGKPAARPNAPAPIINRPTTSPTRPVTEIPKLAAEIIKAPVPSPKPPEPMFERPKAPAPAPAPTVVTPIPEPPRTPAPKPVVLSPPSPRYVTCHCPKCEQGVEFDAAELTSENFLIPCPNCGEEMKLSAAGTAPSGAISSTQTPAA